MATIHTCKVGGAATPHPEPRRRNLLGGGGRLPRRRPRSGQGRRPATAERPPKAANADEGTPGRIGRSEARRNRPGAGEHAAAGGAKMPHTPAQHPHRQNQGGNDQWPPRPLSPIISICNMIGGSMMIGHARASTLVVFSERLDVPGINESRYIEARAGLVAVAVVSRYGLD